MIVGFSSWGESRHRVHILEWNLQCTSFSIRPCGLPAWWTADAAGATGLAGFLEPSALPGQALCDFQIREADLRNISERISLEENPTGDQVDTLSPPKVLTAGRTNEEEDCHYYQE
jgi:hypothetical protein